MDTFPWGVVSYRLLILILHNTTWAYGLVETSTQRYFTEIALIFSDFFFAPFWCFNSGKTSDLKPVPPVWDLFSEWVINKFGGHMRYTVGLIFAVNIISLRAGQPLSVVTISRISLCDCEITLNFTCAFEIFWRCLKYITQRFTPVIGKFEATPDTHL